MNLNQISTIQVSSWKLCYFLCLLTLNIRFSARDAVLRHRHHPTHLPNPYYHLFLPSSPRAIHFVLVDPRGRTPELTSTAQGRDGSRHRGLDLLSGRLAKGHGETGGNPMKNQHKPSINSVASCTRTLFAPNCPYQCIRLRNTLFFPEMFYIHLWGPSQRKSMLQRHRLPPGHLDLALEWSLIRTLLANIERAGASKTA